MLIVFELIHDIKISYLKGSMFGQKAGFLQQERIK